MANISIFTHFYYEDSLDYLSSYLNNFKNYNCTYFFCISPKTENNKIIKQLKSAFPNCFIIEAPNVGKDIGGKLALIDLYLKLKINSDFIIMLHDKKSPHTTLGLNWRKKLFSIIENNNIPKIISLFSESKNTGIVASKDFITNEYNSKTKKFNCTSKDLLQKLILQYNLKTENYDFVGGTMFWIRANIIDEFFTKNPPLEIRATLEKGNVLDHQNGSLSHSWERMFGFISSSFGYKIRGI